jgi:hypothetical protein
MEENETKYIQFPLFLIRGIFTDKKAVINKILDYGIYRYSSRFDCTLYNVARQLIYDHYNDKLAMELKKCIKALNSDIIGRNDDYRGFDAEGQFTPMDEISELCTALNDKHNFNFERLAIEHYQMHLALKSLGITASSEYILKQGKQIEKEIPAKEPMPMLSVKLLFEFRDNEKSEFDIAQLLAYMAIRSILGTKPYVKTNTKHITARMFGYSSHKAKPDELNPAIKDLISKYNSRHHMSKLLLQLKLNWHVVIYSRHTRGLYVGINVSLDTLAMAAEKKKQKFKIELLKKAEIEAQQKAQNFLKQHLNIGRQLNKDGE